VRSRERRLEVASDRLLELMQKGVTVEQVARVSRAFSDAGIMVHAYLMYGFPTETAQDTIDALERVRQLFAAGCIQSAYWHRFAATAHSPVGLHPEEYGITLRPPHNVTFARNDIEFDDPVGTDHDFLGRACARLFTTTCTVSASMPTCVSGSSRARKAVVAAAGITVAAVPFFPCRPQPSHRT